MLYISSIAGGGPDRIVSLFDNTGQEVFCYIAAGVGSLGAAPKIYMFYWAGGSTFTQIGSGFTIPSGTLNIFDLNVVFGGSGSANIYVNGTLRDNGSAAMSGANCSRVSFRGFDVGTWNMSQGIASGQSTVGATLTTAPITGAGLTDNWAGAYTDVNETVYNDAAFISTPTANQISNFAQATTVAQPINAVIVTARANTGAGGPQNLQLDLNVGGTDYFSSTVAQGAGFSASEGIWLTNPATSAPWLASDWASSVKYGVKSIA